MKKRNLFVAAYLMMGVAVGFTSCSNDDVLNGDINNGNEDSAVQQIVLQVANAGDGLTTRAGRPLESSEATQTIENVKVIVCKGTTVSYATTITDWSNSNSTVYTTGGHGREAVIEIPKDDKLSAGSYTVYAIGYHDDSNYTDIDAQIGNIAKGGTFNENVTLAFSDTENKTKAEEIFAGSISLEVESGKGFRTPVVLNRQVAGSFAYVKDIPAMEGASKLQLVASAQNTGLVLGKFGNFDLTGNGSGNDGHINYVVNGTTASTGSDSYVVYEIELSKWFEKPTLDENNDGMIDLGEDNSNWKGEKEYAAGSVFGGTFVIPFAKVADKSTFTLQLVKADGTTVLREWAVKLPAQDGQLSDHTLFTWNGTSFGEGTTQKDGNLIYNVVRNHLYGIGARPSSEPTNPGEGPDEPESLNTKQELTLRVNDNWEVIHNMVID